MEILIAGIVVFLGVHLLPTFPKAREALIARVGAKPYRGLYSLVALTGFVLIIYGFSVAPRTAVWDPPIWTRYITQTLMLPVFVLLASTGLPGKISAAAKHPMLVAIKTWALAHLIANGDIASIILFTSFLAYGSYDRISVKRRAVATPPMPDGFTRNDGIAVVVGLGIYLFFTIFLHEFLFRVPILL